MKISFALGSANFGMIYGISNQTNLMSENQAAEIISAATRNGINTIDTAPSYGSAELIIGKYNSRFKKLNCYSKISGKVYRNATEIIDAIRTSISVLNIHTLEGIYFHDLKMLLECENEVISEAIHLATKENLVKKFGVSIYSPEEITKVTDNYPNIKMMQIPENIFDRRFYDLQIINELFDSGYEINVRSVFLQGLILMQYEKIPTKLRNIIPYIEDLKVYAESLNIELIDLCLSYLSYLQGANKFIIGVSKVKQLEKINQFTKVDIDFDRLPKIKEKELIDPRLW